MAQSHEAAAAAAARVRCLPAAAAAAAEATLQLVDPAALSPAWQGQHTDALWGWWQLQGLQQGLLLNVTHGVVVVLCVVLRPPVSSHGV